MKFMDASEVVQKIQELKELYGDIEVMVKSKYEFDGDLDSDIQNRIEKNKEIQQEFYVDVLNIFKKYGREKAEKLLTDFVVSLKKGELEIVNDQVSKVDKGQIIW